MRFTGPAADLPSHPTLSQAEQASIICRVAASVGVPATLLAAIRVAESGRPGREFGVLSESAPTYEAQAISAAFTIRNQAWRYVQATGEWPVAIKQDRQYSDAFLRSLRDRYAPLQAENDPNDLNTHWLGNVTRVYRASAIV